MCTLVVRSQMHECQVCQLLGHDVTGGHAAMPISLYTGIGNCVQWLTQAVPQRHRVVLRLLRTSGSAATHAAGVHTHICTCSDKLCQNMCCHDRIFSSTAGSAGSSSCLTTLHSTSCLAHMYSSVGCTVLLYVQYCRMYSTAIQEQPRPSMECSSCSLQAVTTT